MFDLLAELFIIRGVPRHIRSDNGPEFIADAMRDYLDRADVKTLYIEKGALWENGYAESFHSRLRHELLNAEIFLDLRDAKGHAPPAKLALGVRAPGVFAATCVEATPHRLAALASAPCPQHTMEPQPTLITTGA